MKRFALIIISIVFCLAGFGQNMGVDQPNPTEKLDINGNLKANSIKFPDGSALNTATRVIDTRDTRGGCPGSWPAWTDLITQTFTLDHPAAVSTSAAIIRNAGGRHDLVLYVDGNFADQTLTYSSASTWEEAYVQWVGNLSAGTHTISIRSGSANIWGCGTGWGSINTRIFE